MSSALPDPPRPVDTQVELLGSWCAAQEWRDSGSRGRGAACSLFIGGRRRGHLGTVLGSLLCSSWRPATSDAFAGPEVAESQVRAGTQNRRRARSSDDPWWVPSGGPEGLDPRGQAQATPSRCPGCLGVRWGKGLWGTQGRRGRAARLGSNVTMEEGVARGRGLRGHVLHPAATPRGRQAGLGRAGELVPPRGRPQRKGHGRRHGARQANDTTFQMYLPARALSSSSVSQLRTQAERRLFQFA